MDHIDLILDHPCPGEQGFTEQFAGKAIQSYFFYFSVMVKEEKSCPVKQNSKEDGRKTENMDQEPRN